MRNPVSAKTRVGANTAFWFSLFLLLRTGSILSQRTGVLVYHSAAAIQFRFLVQADFLGEGRLE